MSERFTERSAGRCRLLRRAPGLITLLALSIPLLLGSIPRAVHAQTITGTLMEVETDQPISLGLVMMLTEEGDSITSTVTDSEGRFSISSDEPGSFILVASAFGFKETPAGVFELGPDGEMEVEFRVAPAPMPIDGIVVALQQPVFEHNLVRNGFVRRITRGLGRFVTPADIEDSAARTSADLLRGMPGVHVTRPGGGLYAYQGEVVRLQSNNDYCAPTFYLDGIRLSPAMTSEMAFDEIAPLQVVDAIEVYRRPAEIPVEYGQTGSGASYGGGPCGVIVIWTKTR